MAEEIGQCPACSKSIRTDHPYSWCSSCGERLPAEIQSRLPAMQRLREEAAKAAESRTTPLTIQGRQIACPICGHDRFWTQKTVMSSRAQALLDAEWAGQAARNYICNRCGYVLWFLK